MDGPRKIALGAALLVLVLAPLASDTSASASAGGASVTVSGRTCKVFANDPHYTTSSSGSPVVNAKARIGSCTGGTVTNIYYELQLQRCYQASYGCIWSTQAYNSDDILGTNQNIYGSTSDDRVTRQVSTSCVSKKYRLVAKITLYVSGSSKSTTDVSGEQSVTC